jgi:hypothetical protein
MAKITSYREMVFAIAMFAIVANLSLSGVAFAEHGDGTYHDSPLTALTDPNTVCGNHLCAPGESSQNPTPVIPVRVH